MAAEEERIVRVGCPAHNCGGRCLLVVYLKDGVITHISTDDRSTDTIADPQLRACVRGRSYLRRQYHPDRLKVPLRRAGPRGEGKFEQISWDEALNTVAGEMQRIKETYGNSALFVPYGTGGLQPAHWLTDRSPLVEPVWRLFGDLQQLQLGCHQHRYPYGIWYAQNRQPASRLVELQIHPDVGLEPR